jgi:hypothetical protein
MYMIENRRGRLRYYLRDAKLRAKKKSLPFDLDLDFLDSIATDKCPIFGTAFIFGEANKLSPTSPSLDRIIPSKGYVRDNVVFISHRANTIKHNVVGPDDLYKVADWLRSKI